MSELPIGSEIELIPGYDHLYNPNPFEGRVMGAFVGARAIVRDSREDEVGFPEVLIEWKKDDWRYAGIPDGWTCANHFRTVKTSVRDSPPSLLDMVEKAKASRECPHCGSTQDPEGEHIEAFMEEFQEAEEAILGSDAFFIVTVKELGSPTPEIAMFDGDFFQSELSDEAREAVEQHLLQLAAQITLNRRQR